MTHNEKLLIALYLRKLLPTHNEHLHFTFMRSTYLYALIQCSVLSLNPMKCVGVRTQLCRCGTQPNYVGVRA